MVVQHNMTSMNANRNLGITTGSLAKSTEKLSSGYKINRAGDNAAGLAISEKMRGQIRGLDQASTNAEDGISMIQTAEGALTETHSILQRMRELAVQASSDTNTDDDRTQIQNEIDQLTQEVDRIATTTEFNTKKLIDGSRQGSVTEKAGKANVDSTFANSNVSAEITTDGSAKAAFTDVIRIEITEDFEAGKSTASTAKYSDAELGAALGKTTANSLYADVAKMKDADIDTAKTNADTALSTAKTNLKTEQAKLPALTTATANAVSGAVNAPTAAASDGKLKAGITQKELEEAVADYKDALVRASVDGTAVGALTTGNKEYDKLSSMFEGGLAVTGSTGKTLDDAVKAEAAQELAIASKQKAVDDAQKNVDILKDDKLVNAFVKKAQAEVDVAAAKAANPGSAGEAVAQEALDNADKALAELNKGKSVMTVTDLFGNSDDTSKFEIGSAVDDDNKLTVTLKNKEGDDTVITINNADKLKAGDVITITAQEMVETKQAATGKEAFRLQVGANAGQEVALGINSMKAKDLDIVRTKEGVEGKALDVTNQASASLAVNAYDMAIQKVSTERAKLGATQNRLEHTISNLDTSAENLQSAESSLRDTDMAEEMTNYSKNNILMQAGQSMLAQANQATQGVLSLLG